MKEVYSLVPKYLNTLPVLENKMKLLSQKHSTYKEKEYQKFWIILPNTLVKQSGWESGQKLYGNLKNGKIVIRKDIRRKVK